MVFYLHTHAVLTHFYLDDSLIKSYCRSLLVEHPDLAIFQLQRLNFISLDKSEIVPSQSFIFLEELFWTDMDLVLPPETKVIKVRQLVSALMQF